MSSTATTKPQSKEKPVPSREAKTEDEHTFTYQFRLYPKRQQEQALNKMFSSMLTTRNWALQTCMEHHEQTGKHLPWGELSNQWTVERNTSEESVRWSAGAQQEMLKRIHLAYGGFFRRLKAGEKKAGHPRYKTEQGFHSVTFVMGKGGAILYPANGDYSHKKDKRNTRHAASTGTLLIQGVPGHIKMKQHREIQGDVKTIQIVRKRHKWYVNIVVNATRQELPLTGKSAGVDMGKRTFIATSDEQIVPAPRFLHELLPRLQKAQQRQAACRGGTSQKRAAGEVMSKTAIRYSKIVGDIHEQIRNSRQDFQNKEILKLVQAYDKIYVEDLDLQGMIEGDAQYGEWAKTHENRNMYDAGIGTFIEKLSSKAASAGKTVIKVDPSYTSQRCFACGHICRENRQEAVFKCVKCGHEDHADVNGSKNIQYRGSGGTFKVYVSARKPMQTHKTSV